MNQLADYRSQDLHDRLANFVAACFGYIDDENIRNRYFRRMGVTDISLRELAGYSNEQLLQQLFALRGDLTELHNGEIPPDLRPVFRTFDIPIDEPTGRRHRPTVETASPRHSAGAFSSAGTDDCQSSNAMSRGLRGLGDANFSSSALSMAPRPAYTSRFSGWDIGNRSG